MIPTGFRPVVHCGPQRPSPKEILLTDEKTYSATYLGSGTFVISKPKRKQKKLRQARLKNPQRGARK